MHYTISVRPDGTQFRAVCPELPGIVGTGTTAGQALDTAIMALIKRLSDNGQPAPTLEIVRAILEQASPPHRT